jgi:hypothetical protein
VDASRLFASRTVWGGVANHLLPASWRRPVLWQLFYHLSKVSRLKFSMENPQLTWMVLRFQHRRPLSNVDRRHVLHWFFHHTGCYTFLRAHARPREVLLFDEGFIHRVVQHYASEIEEPDLDHMRTYIELLPRPDLVIFPIADKRVCEQRVYARGLWERFRHKSAADVSRYMKNAHAVVHQAVAHIRDLGWNVIEVDNDSVTTAVAASELRRKLSQLPQMVSATSTMALPPRSIPSL